MTDRYDVIIVGAGPAGLFAALELAAHMKVLLIEKGPDLPERVANSHPSLLSGWGGSGAFSDGKLTLSTEVGGQLTDYLPQPELERLIEEVDQVYLRFGAPETLHGTDEDELRDLGRRALLADLRLVPARIRHLGTDRCLTVLQGMRDTLRQSADILTSTEAVRLLTEDGRAAGVETADGKRCPARFVIVAPGREGSAWLASETDRLGLARVDNPVDVGVRVEVPAPVMQAITDVAFESKLIFYSKSFDDKVRTFCMCPYGEVVIERGNGVTTVNGHSYSFKRTQNTNFAVLVSTSFTEPFHDPISYGKYLAALANLLGEGVVVQRLGDLKSGRRSTPERIARGLVEPTLREATPGDLSFVLPYRYLCGIMEMLEAMDHLAPGLASRHTLLYGVEVKFYSARLKLNSSLETEVANLFTIGDGAGVTRGLVQASASGLIAAREVLRRA